MRCPPRRWFFAALCFAFAVSLGSNVFLFRQGQTYYRQLGETRLNPLGLSTYPGTPQRSDKPLIVFFGDSRAAEWPIPPHLENGVVVNRGIPQQTTAQVLNRFQAHVAPLKPSVIVLQVGVNDLKTIPLFPGQKDTIIRDCKTNIGQIVRMAVDSGARVVVTTIFPLGTVPLERRLFWSDDVAAAIRDVNGFIRTLSSDRVTVLETGPVLANANGVVHPRYSRDLLHLTPAGYEALNAPLSRMIANVATEDRGRATTRR